MVRGAKLENKEQEIEIVEKREPNVLNYALITNENKLLVGYGGT